MEATKNIYYLGFQNQQADEFEKGSFGFKKI